MEMVSPLDLFRVQKLLCLQNWNEKSVFVGNVSFVIEILLAHLKSISFELEKILSGKDFELKSHILESFVLT